MMQSVSAIVRQRTISLSSSLHHRRNADRNASHFSPVSSLPRPTPGTLPLKFTRVCSNGVYKLPSKRALIPSAEGNNGGNGASPPSGEEDPKRREINLLVSLIVQYPAVRGSIAVALGYWAHIDPWGTFHWDFHDVAIGCALATIPSLMDMIILLPNWEPKRTTRTMKLKMPRDVAEKLQLGGNIKILESATTTAVVGAAATSTSAAAAAAAATEQEESVDDTSLASTTESLINAVIGLDTETAVSTPTIITIEEGGNGDEPGAVTVQQPEAAVSDMVDVERKMTVRVDQHPLRDALQSLQMSRVVSNIGRSLSPPSEALLLFLVHVSEEMLYRGVILVLAVRWCTDNLYYAGVEESLVLPGTGLELAPPQLGAILGGIGLTVGAVGLLVQRELFPLRLLDATKEQLQSFVEDRKQGDGKKQTSAEDAPKLEKKKKVVAGLLERLRSGVVIQQRWIVALEASVEFLQWSTLSTSFLLTGNILAPIAGSMLNDALYSACQRVKNREIKEAMKERAASASERAKQTADLLTAVREHRKNRLEPPKMMGKKEEPAEKKISEEDSKDI